MPKQTTTTNENFILKARGDKNSNKKIDDLISFYFISEKAIATVFPDIKSNAVEG